MIEKHKGKAVQICNYGEYSVDNLINDLSKFCGLPTTKAEADDFEIKQNKEKIANIKKLIHSYEEEGKLNMNNLLQDEKVIELNEMYDNIIIHFSKLYKKIRHLGKHAAGVAVVGTDIADYTCLVKTKGKIQSCYDLNDLEHINCIKFDMLGLNTMSQLRELEELSGHKITDEDREEKEIYDNFRNGNTDGIFQMEKQAPKKILETIHCDCIEDVIAVNALNRPAPLQLKMHETYAQNKLGNVDRTTPFYKLTEDTYGTMLYQEQTVEVAQKIGGLSAEQSFDLLKIMKKADNLNKPEYIPVIEQMRKDFFAGCKKNKLTKEQTQDLWKSMLIYGFNKGHSVGYSLIGIDQMYYKIHYPTYFWYVKMKYAQFDADIYKYSQMAVKNDIVVMLPHVNYTAETSLRKVDGELVIQQGLSIIKDVGIKAALEIEQERKKNGVFKNYDDFYDRCKSRVVTSRVIDTLENQSSALQFNKKTYYKCVVKYNSVLLAKSIR